MSFLKRWKGRTVLFLAVVGPGIITANVDNDAGGILTYSQAGAQYGFLLLWTMIPITLALIVVQEMSARMGAVTGKGLSDLIREEFGLRITFLMMLGILIINFGNVVTEFIGIATSLELFGLSRYVTVPVCGVIVWLIVVKGQYKSVEKVFLAASFFYITYIFAGALAHPLWKDADAKAGLDELLDGFRAVNFPQNVQSSFVMRSTMPRVEVCLGANRHGSRDNSSNETCCPGGQRCAWGITIRSGL